jgi:hypothetical protein
MSHYDKPLIILTSIPPKLRGEQFSLASHSSLQHKIIRSWRNISKKIVSFNTIEEVKCNNEHYSQLLRNDIDVLIVPSSTIAEFTYLPSVRESLLLAAELFPNRVLAFVNADIEIANPSTLSSHIQLLETNDSLISHRCDIPFLGASADKYSPYLGGYDLFACNSNLMAAAADLLPNSLTFALPWWDLYLGAALALFSDNMFLGCKFNLTHVIHNDRWELKNWLDIGQISRKEFATTLKFHKSFSSFKGVSSIEALVSGRFVHSFSLNLLKRRIKTLLANKKWCPVSLHELSKEFINFIDIKSIQL